MIKQDLVSIIGVIVAAMLNVFILTDSPNFIVAFPDFLLLIGIVMQYQLNLREPQRSSFGYEVEPNRRKIQDVLFYTIIGFAAIVAVNYIVIANMPSQWSLGFSSISANDIAFTVLMAIAETQFFQGFLLDAAVTYGRKLSVLMESISVFLIALVVTYYHYFRYGDSVNAMMYVFLAFAVINFITVRTGSLGAATLVHIVNNVYATVGVANSFAFSYMLAGLAVALTAYLTLRWRRNWINVKL